jgi:hypothetical protein
MTEGIFVFVSISTTGLCLGESVFWFWDPGGVYCGIFWDMGSLGAFGTFRLED